MSTFVHNLRNILVMDRSEIVGRISSTFEGLSFTDSNHSYHYKGKSLKSVSYLLKEFEKQEDWDKIAGIVASKKGVSKQSILDEWELKKSKSIVKGKKLHSFAEILNNIPQTDEERALFQFWSELDESRYGLIETEIPMVHKDNLYAGTTDFLLYDRYTNTIIVCDYKTNEDLFKNYNSKKLLAPFSELKDCAYNKYQLQLCFYQLLVEQIGIKVSERWLIWIKPDGYITYKTEDFTLKLKEWLGMKKFSIPSA